MNRHFGVFASVAALTLLFAACAGAAPTQGPGAAGPTDQQPAASPGSGNNNDNQPGTNQQLADQPLIIHTGTMDLEVTDLQPAVDQATALITGMGGTVAESNQSNDASRRVATVTYRIPAERWSDALAGLRGLGHKVLSETTSSQDVTAQVVDLDARIANLRSSEGALQAIMARATTITDVLKVQDELTSVQGDIESMTAQRDHLANQAALSTLTVNFTVPVAETTVASGGWDLGHEIDAALAALVRIGQWVASLLIWVVLVVLPVVVPTALIIYIAVRIRRRWLARRPLPEPVAPNWGGPLPPHAQGPTSTDV